MRPRTSRAAFRLSGLATLILLAGCTALSPALFRAANAKPLRVGANYHAIGPDHARDSFISQYHDAAVRATVKRQLRGMVEMGAQVVKTTLWVVAEPSGGALPSAWSWVIFPPTPQEIGNIRAYVQDVAETSLVLEVLSPGSVARVA